MREIIRHVSSVASVSVTAGNFYFKEPSDGGKIVLLFATKIQTEPSIDLLESAKDWVLTPQDHQIELIEKSSMVKASPGVTIDEEGGFSTDFELVNRLHKM